MLSFAIVAVVPALLWIWLFYIANRYKRSSAFLMILLFFGGFCSGLIALTLNHIVEKYTMFWPGASESVILFESLPEFRYYALGFWYMVGFNEEFAKLVILLLFAYHSKDFREPFDGILYAAVVALGFACVENMFYSDRYGFPVLVLRSIIILPTHIVMSVPMGYFMAKSRFLLRSRQPHQTFHPEAVLLILQGWLISAFLHGTYDALLSLNLERWSYTLLLIMIGWTLLLRHYSLKRSNFSPTSAESYSGSHSGKTSET